MCLSQNNVTETRLMRRSLNKEDNQTTSHVAFAIDLYSASVDDLDTVCCFLDFQENTNLPRTHKNQKLSFVYQGKWPNLSQKKLST